MDWRAIFPMFTVLMGLTFVMVGLVPVKETKADRPPSIASCLGLLGKPVFVLAVLGIFLYVGAEVCMTTFLKPTLRDLGIKAYANLLGPTLFMSMLAAGRLLGGIFLLIMRPRTCFRLSAVLGLAGAAALMVGSPAVTIVGIIAAGLGFANIWPMLFSITVEEQPERSNELSGLMCMAISGGAVVAMLMGAMIDGGVARSVAFIVPAACFAYLLLISLRGGRNAAAA
jgi:fucose permease